MERPIQKLALGVLRFRVLNSENLDARFKALRELTSRAKSGSVQARNIVLKLQSTDKSHVNALARMFVDNHKLAEEVSK